MIGLVFAVSDASYWGSEKIKGENLHELAIAENIVSSIADEIGREDLHRVRRIYLKIGALSDIVPDALQFNFEAITKDTELERSEIVIEEIPLKAVCHQCRAEFEIRELFFSCPHCNGLQIEIVQGEEMEFASLEIDDSEDEDLI